MINTDEILQIAREYDVVTFDVFDTLLIRDVMKPVDVYRFSYGSIGRYFRSLAEILARKTSKTGEVTLKDIGKKCIFSCDKEKDLDMKVCRANPEMFDLYKKLVNSGKKIYAISDMYYDSNFIGELLKKAGYDIPVTVSCEEECDKKSGKLFEVFLQKYCLDKSKVIHIGDSMEADYLGAKKAGIESYLIERCPDNLKYIKYSSRNYEYATFINHGLSGIFDPIEALGYEIVGPTVLSFCQWVHGKASENKFDKLFFLARDMHFIYDVYKELYYEDARYLRVSRKSLKFAADNQDEMIAYLKKEECYGNVAIVDTGWVGMAQPIIEQYALQIDDRSDIGGLYMGIKRSFNKLKRSPRSFACFFASYKEQLQCTIATSFWETLIGTNEPQVFEYRNGEPIFDREDFTDDSNLLKFGARKFISDWVSIKDNKEIDVKEVRKAFNRLFINPLKQDIELIGNLHYEDFKDTKIVSYDENCHYITKPGKFLSDLGDSAWKGAFLKKFGVLYPFLVVGYGVFGTVRLNMNDINRCKNCDV